MRRTLKEIKTDLENDPKSIIFLYRWLKYNDFVGEQCEDLCEYLIENISLFEKIPSDLAYAHTDKKSKTGWSYLSHRSDSRRGEVTNPQSDKIYETQGVHRRYENYLAIDIFNQGRVNGDIKHPCPIPGIGYVLDYEMPIGGIKKLLKVREGYVYKSNDENYQYGIYDPSAKDNLYSPGKCDLVVFDDNSFTILELKKEKSKEPLIRAVLESYTYLTMLDKKRAKNSFKEYYSDMNILDREYPWKAAPLLYIKGNQHDEYINNEKSNLRKLMDMLAISPVWYERSEDGSGEIEIVKI